MKKAFKALAMPFFAVISIMLIVLVSTAAVIPGDINGDGVVDIRDTATILLYISGKPVECVNEAIDTNGDGKIDLNDAQNILKSITKHQDAELKVGDKCEHELTYVAPVAGNCTTAGTAEYWSCAKCAKMFMDENATKLITSAANTIDPAHVPGDWSVITPVTDSSDGEIAQHCIYCNIVLKSEVLYSSGSTGLQYTLNDDGVSYTLSSYGTCTETDIIVPAIYEGLPVTAIGDNAFKNKQKINSITIPYGVTAIGENAFRSCTKLTSVKIPDSLTSLGADAFNRCSKLESIYIPYGVTAIETYTFYNCDKLTSVEIPESVTSIGKYAFWFCDALISVDIPESVTSIGSSAFASCPSLKRIVIPDGVTAIEGSTFSDCSDLVSVLIPDSVTSIGVGAFSGCESLKSVNIPQGVTTINKRAFYNCSNLASVVIPEGVDTIGEEAFSGCLSLKTVDIPDSVTHIAPKAFSYSGLTIFHIPKNITALGEGFVAFCPLKTITVAEGNEYYIIVDNTLIYECGLVQWACEKSIIPSDGTANQIGAYAFAGMTSLESIVIPDCVHWIGEYAFAGCTGLKSVIMPSVYQIMEGAFENCTSLEYIEIRDLDIIETKAFSGCTSLTSLDFPEEMCRGFSIEHDAFAGCTGLKTISFGLSPTSVIDPYYPHPSFNFHENKNPWTGCTGIESIINTNPYDSWSVQGNCIIDYDSAFKWDGTLLVGCNNSVIPENVTTIGNSAFYGQSELESVDLSNVDKIESYAFYGCKSLKNIKISEDLGSVGSYAFSGCESLEYFCILGADGSSEKTTIGRNAFEDCTNLKCVVIPNSITRLESYTFYNCPSLVAIIFNGTEEEWNKVSKQSNWNNNKEAKIIFAADLEYSQGLTYELDECGMQYTVTGIGTCTDTEITIPAVYNGRPVTAIGAYAFLDCTNVTAINLPITVSKIGDRAFQNSGIRGIEITKYLTEIGANPWAYCKISSYGTKSKGLFSFTSQGLIENSTNRLITAETYASSIPDDSAQIIGEAAYAGNKRLTSIIIPDTVKVIEKGAFENCTKLTSVSIKSKSVQIEANPFIGCTSLTTIVTENPDYIFTDNCLINKTTKTLIYGNENSIIPTDGSVTIIGDFAFASCTKLASIEIPASVTSIGDSAFAGCTNLTSIEILAAVTSIGDSAFAGCTNLTSIEIPASVTSIGESAFADCTNLTNVKLIANLTSINDYTFYGCTALTSIEIPNNVASIGNYAFGGCEGLTSVSLSGNLTKIGKYAFYGCTGLSSIEIPDSITSIGVGAFDNCPLTYTEYENAYYLGNSSNPYVVLIKAKDTSITSFKIHENTRIIYSFAFFGCKNIEEFEFGSNVLEIGDYAFSEITEFETLSLPKSLIRIGECAFYNTGFWDYVYYEGTEKEFFAIQRENICLKSMVVCSDGTGILRG